MQSELDILKEICLKLDKNDIPYMLTGSFAANFYAVPRMTRDIDFVIEIQTKDVNRIYKIFQDDFYVDESSIIEAVQYQSMFNIIHNELCLKIDFIIRKNTEYREIEFLRKKRIQLNDTPIWIVSLEDLILSKLYWAKDSLSEMQLKDVKNLLLSSQQIDLDYLNKWIEKLNLAKPYEKVKIDE